MPAGKNGVRYVKRYEEEQATMEMGQPSRALIAYAALADRLSKGGDVVQALMPFFKPIADERAGELFDADKFCARALHLYGLSIPKLAALGWCERLVRERLLEVQSRSTLSTLYRWRGGQTSEPFVESYQSNVDSLIARFQETCRTQIPPDLLSLIESRLEIEFFERLLRLDSMRLLLRKDGPSSLKASPTTINLKPPSAKPEDRVALQLDFVTAEFILDLRDSSQEQFELLSSILFANMAAEAISTFREPLGQAALAGMRVYLDTPLILDMFKVNTGFEHYSEELWSLLKKSGAQIKVFDHTVQETESVIGGRLATLRSGFATTADSAGGIKAQSLSVLEGHVAEHLEERGVVIERDPETSLLRISQRALGSIQSDLDKKMASWKKDAKNFDEKTVFSVIALRTQMNVETTFAKAGAILLTRNTPLVAIANTAWRTWLEEATNESKSRISRAAPIAISDKQFAGLVWLIGGQEQAAPLSRARLVAHCAAAIRPRADVVAKACNLVIEAHGREEGEKFAALMTSRRAEQAVMRSSLGDPENLTQARLPKIVELAMVAAGEFAARAEREKVEAEKRVLVDAHQEAVLASTAALERAKSEAALREAQTDLELRAQRDKAKALEMADLSREISRLSNVVSVAESAYRLGSDAFSKSRLLVVLLFMALLLIVGLLLTDHPVASLFASAFLAICAFWFVPEFFFNPVCQRAALYYFQRRLREEFGKSAEDCHPDFVRGTFAELEAWRAQADDLETQLTRLRQG